MVRGAPTRIDRTSDRSSILLNDQIRQKGDILKALEIADHQNLIFISHSIGALMMLHLITPNVKLAIGLTPTVERMKISPQGQVMSPYFDHWFYFRLIQFLFFILSILPQFIRMWIVKVNKI